MSISDWAPYQPSQRTGKLCYHYCSKQTYLPLRDIFNDHGEGFKVELNYETATYNWCSRCNQHSVSAAVKAGLSHIMFITKYTGRKTDFANRYFIIGYYEIGWVALREDRVAIRAKQICFVPIENGYEVTVERWQRINPNGQSLKLSNLRHATQRINGELLDEILRHLDQHDTTDDYLREVARLKAQSPVFTAPPAGRVYIINIGANTSSPLQSPLFDDGRFELVPIPEHYPLDSDNILSYQDLRQFNQPDKPLLDLFPQGSIPPQTPVHYDPEFLTFTYGDNIKQKSNLRALETGDFLFFLARLVSYDGQRFIHKKAIIALVGFLEIAERLNDPQDSQFTSPAFSYNAHVRRWWAEQSTFDNFAIFKGSPNSRRFRYAVPFDREFVEYVPILKADGSYWDWDRTTALGIIGSNTRTIRMYIDSTKDKDQPLRERFWQRVWEAQELRPDHPH